MVAKTKKECQTVSGHISFRNLEILECEQMKKSRAEPLEDPFNKFSENLNMGSTFIKQHEMEIW